MYKIYQKNITKLKTLNLLLKSSENKSCHHYNYQTDCNFKFIRRLFLRHCFFTTDFNTQYAKIWMINHNLFRITWTRITFPYVHLCDSNITKDLQSLFTITWLKHFIKIVDFCLVLLVVIFNIINADIVSCRCWLCWTLKWANTHRILSETHILS